jgi:signal transduction histidine kinase
VDNALRFSPPDAPVRVTVSCTGSESSVSVSDSGPGVAEEDRDRIFERFSRGHEPAGDGGFGLGLAIGRELARLMDGDLRLGESTSGARFTLTLRGGPAVPDGAAEAEA